jgi:anthranilate/para-aminobenzoate synthase component I
MELIAELEGRGPRCHTPAFARLCCRDSTAVLDFNILIRTLTVHDGNTVTRAPGRGSWRIPSRMRELEETRAKALRTAAGARTVHPAARCSHAGKALSDRLLDR